jgi:anti-anti-sigma factor
MENRLVVLEDQRGKIRVVRLLGILDITTSNQLEQKLRELLDGGDKALVLDLKHLDFISSSGLRVLHMASVRAKNHFGKIVLCGLNESVEMVFQTSGFSKLLTVVGTQDEAIHHLQQV